MMWLFLALTSWQLSEFDLSKLLTGRSFPPDLAFQFVSFGDFPSAASSALAWNTQELRNPESMGPNQELSPKGSSHATRLG